MHHSMVLFSGLVVGLIFSSFLGVATNVSADDSAQVFSLTDEYTLAVIHVQPAALRQMAPETLAPIRLYLSTLPKTGQGILKSLLFETDVADAYLILRSGDPSRSSPGFSPLIVIPNDLEKAERVAQAAGDSVELKQIDGLAILGTADSIADVAPLNSPDIQLEFLDAFSKLPPAPLRCVVRLDDDRRRVIQEFGLAGYEDYLPFQTSLLADLRWFAVAAVEQGESESKSKMQLVFQPRDSIDSDQFASEMMQGIRDKQGIQDKTDGFTDWQVSRKSSDATVAFSLALPAISKQLNNWVVDTRLQLAKQRMQRIGRGMHNFHAAYGRLPSPATKDEQGKPLLSWRVALLPFLGGDEQRLWERFHLDEPWNSPHNLTLVKEMPAVYAVDASVLEDSRSTVEIPVGESLFFYADESKFSEVHDGLSNTIMAFEIPESKKDVWTKPTSLELTPSNWPENVGGRFDESVLVLNGDGSVRLFVLKNLGEGFWQRFTRNGGEILRQ